MSSEDKTEDVQHTSGSTEELVKGTRVGEYRIEGKLGAGGMGSVYSATHPVIGKKAAIKVILGHLCKDQRLVDRFVDEARAVNKIGHPNIVDIFAFGALQDGRNYFVMEWLEGESLKDRIRRQRLSITDAIDILDPMCDALEAAHKKEIIHRDLKPDNVYLATGRGEQAFVKLLDFGLAKLSDSRVQDSNPDMIMGTPQYLSPEQATGGDIEGASDTYSLGVMAYELFLGRLPFRAENAYQTVVHHLTKEPPPPRSIWPGIPPALEDLVLQMLAKEPDDRPPLAHVRSELAELKRACLLAQSAQTGTSDLPSEQTRPVLVRTYAKIGDLIRPLMAELSRGVAWVSAEGDMPSVGTPITIRFEVERLSAHVDFGGLVDRQFGAAGSKALVRYDRVSRHKIDRIFSVAAAASAESDPGTSNEIGARWRAPDPEQALSWARPADVDEPSDSPSGFADTMATPAAPAKEPADHDEVKRTEVSIRRPEKTADVESSVKEVELESPSAILSIQTKRPLFGLGARIFALTFLTAIIAVAVVGALALRRFQDDRSIYVNDLHLRSAQFLRSELGHRLSRWRVGLEKAVATAEGEAIQLGDFQALTLCAESKCETMTGEEIASETVQTAIRKAEKKGFALLERGNEIIVALAAKPTAAVASVPRQALLDGERVPVDFTAFVVDRAGHVLTATGPASRSDLVAHGIVERLRGLEGSRAEAYEAPDGTPMFGAWSGNGDLHVVVITPHSLSAQTVQNLAWNVGMVALVVLAVALFLALGLARGMTHRLRQLAKHAARVAQGDFTLSAKVSGHDEVGQVATTFDEMTRALRQRDEEVVRIQRKMSEDESNALYGQLSEWLEREHASTLNAILDVIRQPVGEEDPARDLKHRQGTLEILAKKATASLERVLAFASIASRRVEFATTVAEAVKHTREVLRDSGIDVELDAPNAVFFPRLEARESEIRELVETLISYAAQVASKQDTIVVSLSYRDDRLYLSVGYPETEGATEAASQAMAAVQHIIRGHGASPSLNRDGDTLSVVLGFPVGGEGPD